MVKRLGLILIAFGLLLVAGCRRAPSATMLSIPPPAEWGQHIADERAAKDEILRSDPTSPLPEEEVAVFAGLDYWSPDPTFYWLGPVNFYSEPQPVTLAATAGEPRTGHRVGFVEFGHAGTAYRLQVYHMSDSEGLFLPFRDGTAGNESYPSGRYVNLEGPRGGPFVLDFNKAYNPYCAYDPSYSCPLTPEENRIDLKIRAGERNYVPGARDGVGS